MTPREIILSELERVGVDMSYVERILIGNAWNASDDTVDSVVSVSVSSLKQSHKMRKLKLAGVKLEVVYVGEKNDAPISASALCKMKPDEQAKIKEKLTDKR
jgi:hypothetical protein